MLLPPISGYSSPLTAERIVADQLRRQPQAVLARQPACSRHRARPVPAAPARPGGRWPKSPSGASCACGSSRCRRTPMPASRAAPDARAFRPACRSRWRCAPGRGRTAPATSGSPSRGRQRIVLADQPFGKRQAQRASVSRLELGQHRGRAGLNLDSRSAPVAAQRDVSRLPGCRARSSCRLAPASGSPFLRVVELLADLLELLGQCLVLVVYRVPAAPGTSR